MTLFLDSGNMGALKTGGLSEVGELWESQRRGCVKCLL